MDENGHFGHLAARKWPSGSTVRETVALYRTCSPTRMHKLQQVWRGAGRIEPFEGRRWCGRAEMWIMGFAYRGTGPEGQRVS
jgi:hypothetical protein